MLSIKSILVPVDFSDQSSVAAHHAVGLAKHFDAALVFAHVIEAPPDEYRAYSLGHAFEVSSDFLEAMKTKLDSFAGAAAGEQMWTAVVLEGDTAHQLKLLADREGIDLVVLATHGRGPFRRFLVGSKTAKLIHDLECPVLTGAHLEDSRPFRPGPFRTVACALGLREVEHSERVLRWAADFATEWSAALHVIHVPPAIEWGAGDWFPPDTKELVQKASRERLGSLIEKVGCTDAQMHVEGIDPIEYVNQVVKDTDSDVLITGRSVGHGLLGGVRTNAYAMIREAGCPVISV